MKVINKFEITNCEVNVADDDINYRTGIQVWPPVTLTVNKVILMRTKVNCLITILLLNIDVTNIISLAKIYTIIDPL